MSIGKASFRKLCVKKLKKSSLVSKINKNHKVSNSLENLINEVNPRSILFYLALPFELDLQTLLKKQKRKKVECFVPFMVGESFKMVTYRLPLKLAKFGVKESQNSLLNIKNVDMVIVPVVGVDADARRVGFGKGMYDRFFSKLTKKPLTVFVQIEECICDEKITDYYDIQADIYITPITIKYKKDRKLNVKSDSLRRWDCHRKWSSRIFDLKKIK